MAKVSTSKFQAIKRSINSEGRLKMLPCMKLKLNRKCGTCGNTDYPNMLRNVVFFTFVYWSVNKQS